jgi:hypothetical protein
MDNPQPRPIAEMIGTAQRLARDERTPEWVEIGDTSVLLH